MFVNHRIGQSNAEINNDMDVNDFKVSFSNVNDLYLNRNSNDEMLLYSEDYSAIRSISFPSSYQSPLSTVANE